VKDDRLEEAEAIFQIAADLPPEQREPVLTERCGNDAELRGIVERLLAHHDRGMGSFLEPMPAPTGIETEEKEPPQSASDHIGPYILRERIGTGGMGEVWKAEQTSPVRRTVALKLIKAGMDSKQVITRFEAERQALALMDHPYIAKVHDAGVTDRGRPYFVMEHVPGVPITEYCDEHRLDTQERLELFEGVCEGIQHAHQKAVIHRDIKPTNILVADVDGKPIPKIIDFGVAKATTQKLTEKTMYTALGQLIGTPEYMSPEQADLTGEDVDTRTDVYSLGVVLYELLVGALPFESSELREAGFEGILKTLREKDPPRPSTKLSTLGEKVTPIARSRRTEPRRLAGQLKGDLDWIMMRALEKDRTRRYGSPRELAQDIRRHLSDEPVLAGPPSAAYRSRKFVKRHRVGVGFAATIGIAVILAFVLVTVQNARVAAARDEAEAARDEAVLVTATLEEMLASVDPTKSGRDVTVLEMLDETAKTLGEKFHDQPLIEARLRYTVGRTYDELSEFDAAEKHLRRAVEIRSARLGVEDPGTLDARNRLARVYEHQSRYRESGTLVQETLEIARRVLGEDHHITLESMNNLAVLHLVQGRYDEAEVFFRKILEIERRILGEGHRETVRTMKILANSLSSQNRHDEAQALRRRTLEIARRYLGDEHSETLDCMTNLAASYMAQRRYEEAEALQRETLEVQRRVQGEEHRDTLINMMNLGTTNVHLGDYVEGEALVREALDISRRKLGEEHQVTVWAMDHLAMAREAQSRRGEAEAVRREILEINRRVRGEDHPDTELSRYALAANLALQGRRNESISFLRDLMDNGYRDPAMSILDDPDLASLHGDPEFEAIVEELRRRNEETNAEAAAVESE
jgi:non-specific serine/threonine protein kinase/serine/threonine-protein kinase